MMKKIVLTALFILFTAAICSGARYSYTWRNEAGKLFITDYPPPAGAEIIEISVIPMPEPKKIDPAVEQQKRLERESEARKQLLNEAETLRKEELALRQKASKLTDEAMEQRRLSKLNRYSERYRRRASNKEEEAENLIREADSLAGRIRELKRRAAQLK